MDLREVLGSNGIDYKEAGQHHHARSGWIQIDCPFCGPSSRKYHLGYNISNAYFNCWSCGPHSVFEVLRELTGLGTKDIKDVSKNLARNKVETVASKRGKLKIPFHVGKLKEAHKFYLINIRGFCPSILEKQWRIGGISFNLKLPWRIFIPIHYKGNVVSWTTRAIRPNDLRYFSASEEQEILNHKHLLYGEDYCRHSICCVEGPTDAWAIGPGAVATLGTGFSMEQVKKLSRYPVRGICFDASRAAQKRAQQLIDLLSIYPGVTYNFELETGEDPASAKKSEIDLIRKALEL